VNQMLIEIADKKKAAEARAAKALADLNAARQDVYKLTQLETLAKEFFANGEALTKNAAVTTPASPVTQSAATVSGTTITVPTGSMTIVGHGFVTSKRQMILNGAQAILSDGRRRSSRELLAELKAHGVEVGGADEVNNLSSYLSVSELFDSDRPNGGWGLKSPKKASPSDGDTSQGLIPTNGA
jgi:hypothetical protein